MKKIYLLLLTLITVSAYAGNPDRQGEAGASELLFNPWARSAGLHSMTTSSIMGVESMRLNIAGLSRITKNELLIGNARLYEGADMGLNALGFATKVGENGAFGISLNSVDFGEIEITTEDQPAGTGGFYSPNFFNLGLGYAYTYENKVSVGVLVRLISEALPSITSSGVAIDAGVQYVTGDDDNFKLGISLRNIGSPMKFGGQGLSTRVEAPGATHLITIDQRSVMDKFAIRGGYKYELDQGTIERSNLYTGLAVGASIDVPISKAGSTRFGVDYAYRATDPFDGSHNLAIKLTF